MFNYLRLHPEVAMSARKEPHHFCEDLSDRGFVRNREDYLALFGSVGSEPMVGEASVWYMYSRLAAERIHEFDDGARLIAILRNPTEMLPSIFWHHVFTGYESSDDFEAIYRQRRGAGTAAVSAAEPGSFRGSLDYSLVAQYGAQLERFYHLFPASQIHVLLLEDLKEDPNAAYRSTAEFLGIDPDFSPSFERYNPQRSVRSKSAARAIRALQRAGSPTRQSGNQFVRAGQKVWGPPGSRLEPLGRVSLSVAVPSRWLALLRSTDIDTRLDRSHSGWRETSSVVAIERHPKSCFAFTVSISR